MTLIAWKASFGSGHPSVDHEHKNLIALINEMYSKIGSDCSQDLIDHYLGEIHALVEAHFALEEKIIVRVGGPTSIHTDARVVATLKKNLVDLVTAGTFREDLYYRLNVVSIELPPLRERGDDVLQLADYFLAEFCRKVGRKLPKLTAAARRRLLEHPWPGNVRELRNLMERIACLLPEDCVEAHDLAFTLSPGRKETAGIDSELPLAEATHAFQAERITTAIDAARGNMSTAAKRLGLHRSNLYRKMRQLGLSADEDDIAAGS